MLIQFALSLVVLLGFCGLALDAGMMELTKLKLQNAADAAALAASYPWAGGDTSGAWQAAKADAALNGFTDGQNGAAVAQPVQPATGTYANNTLAVQVTITQTVTPIFFAGARTMSAQATALGASATTCVYLFSRVFSSPSLDGSGENITTDCGVYLGRNYNLSSGGSTGGQFLVVGASSQSQGSVSPAPTFKAPQQVDPLQKLAAPVMGSCNTSVVMPITTDTTLFPGTYCQGISAQNTSVGFIPGTYIIAGSFSFSNSNIAAPGVTFYMTGNSSYPRGVATINGGKVTWWAPTSGPRAGIAFFVDRSLTAGNVMLNISGITSSSTIDGILYAPGQEVQASNSTLVGKNYFSIVADYFQVSNTHLEFSSDYAGAGVANPFQSTGGGGGNGGGNGLVQ